MSRIPPLGAAEIEALKDPEIEGYFRESHRLSTPEPIALSISAQQPQTLKAWCRFWWVVFRRGLVEHPLKELVRVHISQLVGCEF